MATTASRAPDGTPPRPRVPAPVRATTEAAFAAMAKVRGARPFHPRGASFTATLRVRDGSPLPFLDAAPHLALVRLSNAAGLPAWSPDVLGLAIRIPYAAGAGRPQDLLLASSGHPPGVRHLLVPARGFDTACWSSLLLYRHRGELLVVGARFTGPPPRRPLRLADVERAAADGALRFVLSVCAPFGPWRPVAELDVHDRLPALASAGLRFNPWNTCPDLRPVGPLNHLRAAAYEAAQRTATSE